MAHTSVEQLADEVGERVKKLLHERLATLAETAQAPQLDADELAGHLAAVVPVLTPSHSEWDEILGPFYTTAGVRALLGGVTRQAVESRRQRDAVLGCRTDDGTWLYPTFQFVGADDERVQVLRGLPATLKVFADAGFDGWTLGWWLRTANIHLEGCSPEEWLRSGRSADVVAEAAAAQRRDWRDDR